MTRAKLNQSMHGMLKSKVSLQYLDRYTRFSISGIFGGMGHGPQWQKKFSL